MSERVEVETSAGAMPAHRWLPSSGTGPGLLLVQEIFGVTPYIERRAQDLADLGYVVLAPELFHRLGVGKVDDGPSALEEGMGLLQRLSWPDAVADAVAAVAHLRGQAEVAGGVGVVGFCFGGGLGYQVAAETPVDVLVSYYGSALPALLGLAEEQPPGIPVVDPTAVTAPSLHHFGLVDAFLPRPVVEQMAQRLTAVDTVTVRTYATGDHAFDNPDFHLHDEASSHEAWGHTAAFLREHLPARLDHPGVQGTIGEGRGI